MGTEFPDLEIPTCDLSVRTDKLRFARFLMSQERVKAFLRRKLEEESLPEPVLAAGGTDNSSDSGSPVRVTSSQATDQSEVAQSTSVREDIPRVSRTGLEDRERCALEVESSRDRAFVRSLRALKGVFASPGDRISDDNPSMPLSGHLEFARTPVIRRPKQAPSARRTILVSIPEAEGLATTQDLHPVLASHANTEAEKLLRGRVKQAGELRSDVMRAVNFAMSFVDSDDPRQDRLAFALLAVAGIVEHSCTTEV